MIPLMLASSKTLGLMVAGFTLFAIVELFTPLHPRQHWNRIHLGPNLALTVFTVATGVVFNAALVLALMALEAKGLLHWLRLPPVAAVLLVVAALDLATYGLHVLMHKVPLLWRVHRVHHADPVLDVTTALRQHPVEGLMRYLALGIPACILGASPAAFAAYRVWSLLNGLGEHANLKVPRWLDRLLVPLFITPDFHKVHHSRSPALADTNYGNIFSLYDRLFSTCTSSDEGPRIRTGLEGYDNRAQQTIGALLALPFRPLMVPSPSGSSRRSRPPESPAARGLS
jgi:sterol desaturase/sphingolipid hydroxylase (fatty acid hydroxylase superfamily)